MILLRLLDSAVFNIVLPVQVLPNTFFSTPIGNSITVSGVGGSNFCTIPLFAGSVIPFLPNYERTDRASAMNLPSPQVTLSKIYYFRTQLNPKA